VPAADRVADGGGDPDADGVPRAEVELGAGQAGEAADV
jgi:hypothetical protein